MMADVLTVVRKEWLEILDQFMRFRRGGWTILLVIFFLGVFIPIQIGAEWATTTVMFFYWPFLTASMTSTVVADAVAGERERHTLETLLATRLPDRAILLGKVIAAVTYGYAFALTNVAIGMVTVQVRFGEEATRMSWARFGVLLALIGSTSLLVSGLGLVVSLRAATVRQAQQMFGVFFLLATMVPLLAIAIAGPERQAAFSTWVANEGVEGVGVWASLVSSATALMLIVFALARFQRGTRVMED